jgi:RNA-binding protein
MNALTPKRRSELRAEAHKLKPLVLIGDKGLTDEVLAEIDRSLKAHELIKIRASTDEREARDAWLDMICTRLEAHAVQQIGKVFVVYRENPDEESQPAPAKASARGDKRRVEVVSERGKLRQRSRDMNKQRARDAEDMQRKGKIPADVKLTPRLRGDDSKRGDERKADSGATRTSRPRSRTPSPLPASGPPRRRPRTSR